MARNTVIILVAALMVIGSGCKKEELEALRQENQKLSQQIEKKDSTIAALNSLNDQIEKNLQQIAQRQEGFGSMNFNEVANDNIRERLVSIRDQVKENQEKTESYRDELQGTRYQANEYRKKVSQLEGEVNRLEDSVKTIREDLMAKTQRIETMSSEMAKQDSTLSELTEQNTAYMDSLQAQQKLLNTGYVAAGPEKKLQDDNVIMKEGGFLGFLGQTAVLNPEFDQSDFDAIDIYDKTSMTVEAKVRKVEVVTQHPANSYEIEEGSNDNTVLNITDPDRFWRAGKYLVVIY